jgi:hypothetical protein
MMSARHGVPLGSVAGIRVRADWSLLVIFGLITLSLAGSVFPARLPGQAALIDWLLAFVATGRAAGGYPIADLSGRVIGVVNLRRLLSRAPAPPDRVATRPLPQRRDLRSALDPGGWFTSSGP